MRLSEDIRQAVVFIGHADWDDDESFVAKGTGFFVLYKAHRYLITCRHVSEALGDAPFCIRVNKHDGGAENIHADAAVDNVHWIYDPQAPDVDLAAMPFNYDLGSHGLHVRSIPEGMFAGRAECERLDIGVGDGCYAVGLFRLLQGKRRNLPVVHRASIALMPGDELIPVSDWLAPHQGKTRFVDGYLVECSNLEGLSGSPVVVRPSILVDGFQLQDGANASARIGRDDVRLLGIWSASWDAPLGQLQAMGGNQRVPIGFGTVVPIDHLVALLEMPSVAALRRTS